jgi:hypothetical protein
MKLFARRALAFVAWSPLLLTAAGCSNQGEGERCDQRHVNTDCDEGLICVVIEPRKDQICCPFARAATVAACNASSGGPRDSGTPSDGSSSDAGVDSLDESNDADGASNEAAVDAIDNRSTPDISGDMRADMSMPDVSADGVAGDARNDLPSTLDQTSADGTNDTPSVDAAPDTAPDATADVVSETSDDAPDHDVTPDVTPPDVDDDAADAPTEAGPG